MKLKLKRWVSKRWNTTNCEEYLFKYFFAFYLLASKKTLINQFSVFVISSLLMPVWGTSKVANSFKRHILLKKNLRHVPAYRKNVFSTVSAKVFFCWASKYSDFHSLTSYNGAGASSNLFCKQTLHYSGQFA